MWATIVVITALNLFSTILYILSSFGNAIFLQLGWQICATCNDLICSGAVAEAVFYISLSTLTSAPLQVYSMWSSINWKMATHLTMAQLVGGYVGITLLFIVKSVWMVRSLGILFSIVAIQYILKEASAIAAQKFAVSIEKGNRIESALRNDDLPATPVPSVLPQQPEQGGDENLNPLQEMEIIPSSFSALEIECDPLPIIPNQQSSSSAPSSPTLVARPEIWNTLTIWGVGLSSGLLGGLFGTPGPPLMIYVTRSSMKKDEVRGTIAVSNVFLTTERLIMMTLLPNSSIDLFTSSSLYAFLGILLSSLAGRVIGDLLSRYVDETLFRRIIIALLCFGSANMMTSGVFFLLRLVVYVLIFALYGLIGYLAYLHDTHSHVQVATAGADIAGLPPSLWKYYQVMSASDQRRRGSQSGDPTGLGSSSGQSNWPMVQLHNFVSSSNRATHRSSAGNRARSSKGYEHFEE
jgi:uncharacterized membrane protein YfcA